MERRAARQRGREKKGQLSREQEKRGLFDGVSIHSLKCSVEENVIKCVSMNLCSCISMNEKNKYDMASKLDA